MGTSSITKIIATYKYKNEKGKTKRTRYILANIYRHYDGYLEEHGLELAEFLKDIHIVSNVSYPKGNRKEANGAACLAAQIVAHFKTCVGNIYLQPINAGDCGQEYEYYVTVDENEGTIELKALDVRQKRIMHKGSPHNLIEKLHREDLELDL